MIAEIEQGDKTAQRHDKHRPDPVFFQPGTVKTLKEKPFIQENKDRQRGDRLL